MKRSFSKRAAVVFWFVGSCGAVLWACWWLFAIIYIKKISFGLLAIVGFGIAAAWEGFKMFKAERNSN